MTAVTFTLTDLETGRRLGQAIVCSDARYAAVLWRGASRLERRFAPPALWRSVMADLRPGLPAGPLPADGALVELLVDRGRRRSIIVQYVTALPLVSQPEFAAGSLDGLLREIATS